MSLYHDQIRQLDTVSVGETLP